MRLLGPVAMGPSFNSSARATERQRAGLSSLHDVLYGRNPTHHDFDLSPTRIYDFYRVRDLTISVGQNSLQITDRGSKMSPWCWMFSRVCDPECPKPETLAYTARGPVHILFPSRGQAMGSWCLALSVFVCHRIPPTTLIATCSDTRVLCRTTGKMAKGPLDNSGSRSQNVLVLGSVMYYVL